MRRPALLDSLAVLGDFERIVSMFKGTRGNESDVMKRDVVTRAGLPFVVLAKLRTLKNCGKDVVFVGGVPAFINPLVATCERLPSRRMTCRRSPLKERCNGFINMAALVLICVGSSLVFFGAIAGVQICVGSSLVFLGHLEGCKFV